MNLDQLMYVIEVAKTGSISKASENLHMTQSGLSQSISQLEEELGCAIFKRSRLGSIPTEHGKEVIKMAHEIMEKIQQVKSKINVQNEMFRGKLYMMAMPIILIYILRTIKNFKEIYPQISIELKESATKDIIDAVRSGEIEFGIITLTDSMSAEMNDLHFEKLVQGKVKVFVSAKSPLAFDRYITIRDILDQPFLLYNSDYILKMANYISGKYGKLNIILKTSSTDVLKQAIAENFGISIAPSFGYEDFYTQHGGIVTLDLDEINLENTYLGLVRKKGASLSVAAGAYLQHLKTSISDMQKI